MTRTGQAAIDYAHARVGENVMTPGYCLAFTRECFDVAPLYGSAIEAWNATQHPHPGDRNPPPAVPVWFATPSKYDHVCIRTEGATVITTINDDVRQLPSIAELERQFDGTYLGWSEDINGVRVWSEEADDMTPEQDATLKYTYQAALDASDRAQRALDAATAAGAAVKDLDTDIYDGPPVTPGELIKGVRQINSAVSAPDSLTATRRALVLLALVVLLVIVLGVVALAAPDQLPLAGTGAGATLLATLATYALTRSR